MPVSARARPRLLCLLHLSLSLSASLSVSLRLCFVIMRVFGWQTDRNIFPPFVTQCTAPHKCLFLLEESYLKTVKCLKISYWQLCLSFFPFLVFFTSPCFLLFLLFKFQYIFYSLLWLRFIFRSSFLSLSVSFFLGGGDLLLCLHTILSFTAFRRFSKSNLKSIRHFFCASISIIQ